MWIDSQKQAFLVPKEKLEKFAILRESILAKKSVSLKVLQRFMGKCISFMLAVPGARLYISDICIALSEHYRSGSFSIVITGTLKDEVIFCRFIDNWDGFLPWKLEKHKVVKLTTDSSNYKWAGKFETNDISLEFGDYWHADVLDSHIIVKEARAIILSLKSVKNYIPDSRIDILCDCKSFIDAWNGQGSKSPEVTVVLKELFILVRDLRIYLNFCFVTSEQNPVDDLSRSFSKEDTMLSNIAWERVQQLRTGNCHTLDLMALDSNAMVARDGKQIKHFTPYATPHSAGINMFAQDIDPAEICYVFPPFKCIEAVLAFILQQNLSCTLIVPDFPVKQSWWPNLVYSSSLCVTLGVKGDKDILLYPSKKGYIRDKKGLPWNLLVFHIYPTRLSKCICYEPPCSFTAFESYYWRFDCTGIKR
ncbi:hypothetical protein SNE40_018237 [Patella caerulea]|uniref:Uncharacterized protein n=1 Tax=Patella caerulea TaxID=87958 RepID=A0AAN8PJT9_PATCE